MALKFAAAWAKSGITVLGLTLGIFSAGMSGFAMETIVPVRIEGGHEIGKNDFGRPVVLIAAALAVKPEVFREAFSGVTPARGRGPTGQEARKNKEALMKVLAPKAVTNERLDEVSDYYRFQPQSGKIWTHKQASAQAVIVDGKIARIVVTEPGNGYSSQPKIVVPGFEKQSFIVSLNFSTDFKKNGAIKSIELSQPDAEVQKKR